MDAQPHETAARAIVEALRARGDLEGADDVALVGELAAALGAHLAALEAIAVDVSPASPNRWDAFVRAASSAGLVFDDEAVAPLTEQLAARLDASPHVEEIFADDQELFRILQAALFDFVAAEKDRLFERLRRDPAPRAPSRPRRPPTLADLGLPFRLFEAPRSEAVTDEAGPCVVCGASAPIRFRKACHACFRAGKVASSMGTELGTVFSETAATGWTHGLPKGTPYPSGFAQRLHEAEGQEGWVQFQVDPAHLVELVRTPAYGTWQGEHWLFCCKAPMVYRGQLDSTDLVDRPPGDAPSDYLAKLLSLGRVDADDAVDEILAGRFSVYAFRCALCGNERAHGDRT